MKCFLGEGTLLGLFYFFIKASPLCLLLGCRTIDRLSTLGETPKLTQIKNPITVPGYQPVDMPMPDALPKQSGNHGSLWPRGAGSFFKDRRAKEKGDILTVCVEIDQKESIQMNPTIQRESRAHTVVKSALGLERGVDYILPQKGHHDHHPHHRGNQNWISLSSNPSMNAQASYDVQDRMSFKMAAHVIQKLPNGNMVIKGRQEIRLVNEVREVTLTGIVRRCDITSGNTITADKIAELRISYGGRGDLSEMQEFPWGQQVLNTIVPF